MYSSRVKELVSTSERLFAGRQRLDTYWQEVAENFYPERAEFAGRKGEADFWTGLMSSEPVLVRRELANVIQSMLRPTARSWFGIHVTDEALDEDNNNRRYLEWASETQRRAMYYPAAHFTEATKQADNDWVTFGNAVIEIEARTDQPSLIYRTGHLRDHAWTDNHYGETDTVYRRWKPTARQLAMMFPKTVHEKVQEAADKEPEKEIECCRIVMPRDAYDMDRQRSRRADWVSIYVDKENEVLLEEAPRLWMPYVIPRWQTVSGSQYGWSPCTGPGLADARTLQAVVRVLLEAGEKAVDPPLVATDEVVRSDLNVYAGGVTWVDAEYDEKLGAALRPLSQDRSGLPVGMEMADRFSRVLTEGFYLNKIRLPADQGEMTAYEVRKRLEEHIRSATPLLAPAEEEYSSRLCERTFDALRWLGAFGPENEMPAALRGRDIEFEFVSPMRELADEMKSQKLIEAVQVVGQVAQIDPTQTRQIDWDTATRDALAGRGIPADWLLDEKKFAAIKQELARAKQVQEGMAGIQQGAEAAGGAAQAAQALQEAGIV